MTIAPYRFVTSCYGSAYLPFLLTFLESTNAPHIEGTVTVLWSDMKKNEVSSLMMAFPQVSFIQCKFSFATDPLIRISSKTKILKEAVKLYPGEKLCLIDNDTIVLKDIGHFFEESFDVAFTCDYLIPKINTGVILVKNKAGVNKFFDAWEKETFAIFNDPIRFSQANSRKFPHYGGTDQMSFYHLIGFKSDKNKYQLEIRGTHFLIKGFSCKYLNEINSVPITYNTHIVHYKGKHWREIIMGSHLFTTYRNRRGSTKMLSLFIRTYSSALNTMEGVQDNLPTSFTIKPPPYVSSSGKFNLFRYLLFRVSSSL